MSHRIVFVTGKGGVGKSAVAAATALQLAREGQRVLLVELGGYSFYGPLLGLPIDVEPVAWRENIGVARLDAEAALREYIAGSMVFKAAAKTLLDKRMISALVAGAPTLSELALLGKLTAPGRPRWYRRGEEVDTVVVDACPTGQFMALLRAPRGLAETVTSGAMHTHTQAMIEWLADAERCEYRIVTLAEDMPVTETCEMAADLRAETGLAPRIYCNRLLDLPPRLPTRIELDAEAEAGADGQATAEAFLRHMRTVANRQKKGLAALAALGKDKRGAVVELPLVLSMEPAVILDRLAEALA